MWIDRVRNFLEFKTPPYFVQRSSCDNISPVEPLSDSNGETEPPASLCRAARGCLSVCQWGQAVLLWPTSTKSPILLVRTCLVAALSLWSLQKLSKGKEPSAVFSYLDNRLLERRQGKLADVTQSLDIQITRVGLITQLLYWLPANSKSLHYYHLCVTRLKMDSFSDSCVRLCVTVRAIVGKRGG